MHNNSEDNEMLADLSERLAKDQKYRLGFIKLAIQEYQSGCIEAGCSYMCKDLYSTLYNMNETIERYNE